MSANFRAIKATAAHKNLAHLGLDHNGITIRYSQGIIDGVVQDLLAKDYAANPAHNPIQAAQAAAKLDTCFPIMLQFIGSNLTSFKLANKKAPQNVDAIIQEFEQELATLSNQGEMTNQEAAAFFANLASTDPTGMAVLPLSDRMFQLLGSAFVIAYNSARSTGANNKSSRQKNAVKTRFAQFNDPRLHKIMLGEPKGLGFSPKPDGLLDGTKRKYRNQSHIIVYLRHGNSDGGSQGDRAESIQSAPKLHPTTDFLFIWDGVESDPHVINRLNEGHPVTANSGVGAVYATTLADLDEVKLLALFDRP